MNPHYLYFLYSDSIDHFYIGSAVNPGIRLEHHNSDNKGWTKRGRPWRMVFSKEFPTKSEAHKWERWVKEQKSRELIEQMIEGRFEWKAK